MKKYKWLVPTLYIIFLMLPIYWLINMSFKTTTEIINTYSLWPQKFTLENYVKIFTDSTWYMGYVNSFGQRVYVFIISVVVLKDIFNNQYIGSIKKIMYIVGTIHLYFFTIDPHFSSLNYKIPNKQ